MGKPRAELSARNTYNSFSFLNILKKIIASHPICRSQHEANRYLDGCHSELDIAKKLYQIIDEKNPNVLEFFLRGIKKKNLNEIAIPNSFVFGEKINSLTYCVLFGNPSLLAIMLHYGANPNYKTWLTSANKKYVDEPPLLRAFLEKSKPAIRLLVIYGASLDKIAFNELIPRFQKFKISDTLKDFYNKIIFEVNQLHLIESEAQNFERNRNYKAAFECYKKIGDYEIKLASTSKLECGEDMTLRRKLSCFYIRRSLIPYARALYCIEKHLENLSINSNEIVELHFKVKEFYSSMLKATHPIRQHEFLNEKVQPLIDSWERITELFKQFPSCFEDCDSDSSGKENHINALRQRKMKEKNACDNTEESRALLKYR